MIEKGMSLYDITNAYSTLEDILESGNGAELQEYLDTVRVQMKTKLQNILGFARNLELTSDSVGNEIKRLQAYQKSLDAKNEALRKYIAYCMDRNGITKVDTDIGRLSFRKSNSVEIDEISLIPEKYMVEKMTKTPDKKLIKEDLQKGMEVGGAHIEEKRNLQIK